MSVESVRRLVAGITVASLVIVLSTPTGASALPLGIGSSATTLAAKINATAKDAPTIVRWVSTKASVETASVLKLGKQTVVCMKKGGSSAAQLSPDPFGTVGKAGGDVQADVQSAQISQKGSSTGLPSFSSEVVILSSATQALGDLRAFASRSVVSCLADALTTIYSSEANSKADITWNYLSRNRYGNGNGGLHVQFILRLSSSSSALYDDEYFYVEGRSEVEFQFYSLGTPFETNWMNPIVANVMARAKSLINR